MPPSLPSSSWNAQRRSCVKYVRTRESRAKIFSGYSTRNSAYFERIRATLPSFLRWRKYHTRDYSPPPHVFFHPRSRGRKIYFPPGETRERNYPKSRRVASPRASVYLRNAKFAVGAPFFFNFRPREDICRSFNGERRNKW